MSKIGLPRKRKKACIKSDGREHYRRLRVMHYYASEVLGIKKKNPPYYKLFQLDKEEDGFITQIETW